MFEEFLTFIKTDLIDAIYNLLPEIYSLFLAFLLGLFIFYFYRRSYKGVVFNHGFFDHPGSNDSAFCCHYARDQF